MTEQARTQNQRSMEHWREGAIKLHDKALARVDGASNQALIANYIALGDLAARIATLYLVEARGEPVEKVIRLSVEDGEPQGRVNATSDVPVGRYGSPTQRRSEWEKHFGALPPEADSRLNHLEAYRAWKEQHPAFADDEERRFEWEFSPDNPDNAYRAPELLEEMKREAQRGTDDAYTKAMFKSTPPTRKDAVLLIGDYAFIVLDKAKNVQVYRETIDRDAVGRRYAVAVKQGEVTARQWAVANNFAIVEERPMGKLKS